MFALGHLGIGKKLAARPFRDFSPADRRAFFVGALLPDLIDKPLYYIPAWVTGKEGAAAGILSGTHLFAHTGLFLVVLTLAARADALPAAAGAGDRGGDALRPRLRGPVDEPPHAALAALGVAVPDLSVSKPRPAPGHALQPHHLHR